MITTLPEQIDYYCHQYCTHDSEQKRISSQTTMKFSHIVVHLFSVEIETRWVEQPANNINTIVIVMVYPNFLI
jgi:hypothetical protein